MLGTQIKTLIFPRLSYLKDIKFDGDSGNKKSSLFQLDWSWHDECLRLKYFTDKDRVPPQLPQEYEDLVCGLIYAVPPNYKREINRLCNLAINEFSIDRPFDTSIREMLTDVADQAIVCAFKLLSDCVYDRDTNYFYHKPDKFLIWRILVYRFWVHQTGRGLPWFNADLDKLDMEIRCRDMQSKDKQVAKDFIHAVKKLEHVDIIKSKPVEEKSPKKT